MKKRPTDLSGRVCVIGGGAAGLMAACSAAECGAQTVLFEKNPSEKTLPSEAFFDNAYLGKKLLITGKGRCNLTNDCDRDTFLRNIVRGGKFLYAAFSAFPPADVMAFFESRGTPLKVERGGRVFPVSDRSLDILRPLKESLKRGGCLVIRSKIEEILSENGRVIGLRCDDGTVFRADTVILCTGGLSYPITGSDGDGYRFAAALGHTVTPLRPSLVPIVSDDPCCRRLMGLSLRNVTLSLRDNESGKTVFRELGEMLFTHFGVSGPLVLSASARMEKAPDAYGLHIDLKPALDEKTLDARLLSELAAAPRQHCPHILSHLLPSKLVPVFLERCEIPPELAAGAVTKAQRHRILALFKDFPLRISGLRPIEEAVITRGGVRTDEVNPATMASKRVGGLYFAGEILDTDGLTGGFNLQIAFSTARLAGRAATRGLAPQSQ